MGSYLRINRKSKNQRNYKINVLTQKLYKYQYEDTIKVANYIYLNRNPLKSC